MQRGTLTIIVIVGVALIAAVSSVVFHYSNQRNAQQFWGVETAHLIDRAKQVDVIRLEEPSQNLSLDGEDDPPPPTSPTPPTSDHADSSTADQAKKTEAPRVQALEFSGTPWIIAASQDAEGAKGINNLRRALVLDTTYNWSEPPATTEPHWQYGLAMTDDRDWITVLFDFESRQIGLAGGHTTALLNPEANDEFKQFFDEQFAVKAATEATPATEPANESEPANETESASSEEPAAGASP